MTCLPSIPTNWRVERMSLVDRNILRIAVYEMQYCDQAPAQVAINEALEIAKTVFNRRIGRLYQRYTRCRPGCGEPLTRPSLRFISSFSLPFSLQE